jgi:Rieske Fe-S protein
MDKDRRNWLIATSAVGGVGAAAALYPFVDSFEPSERAKAAGAAVEIDIAAASQFGLFVVLLSKWPNCPKSTVNWLIRTHCVILPNLRLHMPKTNGVPLSLSTWWW